MTTPPPADIEAIRKRHADNSYTSGALLWSKESDKTLVQQAFEAGAQAHEDRATLLSLLSTQGAGVTREELDTFLHERTDLASDDIATALNAICPNFAILALKPAGEGEVERLRAENTKLHQMLAQFTGDA